MSNRLSFFLILLLSTFSFCEQIKDVDNNVYVTSDAFRIRADEQVLVLSKNVQIKSYSYQFNSDLVEYSMDKDIFHFQDKFSIIYKGQEIQGQNLELNNKSKMLTANNVLMNFDKYLIKGSTLKTVRDEYHLDNVKVTACDGDPPVFYISSGQMVMYPKLGFMVVFNSIFYVYNIPVFYFPAYFMGGHQYSKVSEFIPEFGSSEVEGNYIKERIPYYIDSRNSGSFFLGYLEKFGPKLGFEHFVILGPKNLLNASFYYNPKFLQGGLEYSYDFFQKEEDNSGYLFWYLFDKDKIDNSSLKFKLKWYQKELVNNWFVDQVPRSRLESVFKMGANNTVQVNYEYAQLKELTYSTGVLISDWRRQIDASLLTGLSFGIFNVNNSLSGLKSFYSDSSHSRAWDSVSLIFPYDIFEFSVGSEFVLGYEGTSPFKHDLYEISDENNFLYGMKALLPYFLFEFEAKKKWSGDYYQRKYTFKLPFHNCVDFSFSYDDIKDQFSVVFKM
ncbi:MAG: hypothetical protein PHF25_02550 [Candidatus Margulisbacteria bacterium]|nr:hypothetical protein [Candidatus Margulisiibacteriota bacterium]